MSFAQSLLILAIICGVASACGTARQTNYTQPPAAAAAPPVADGTSADRASADRAGQLSVATDMVAALDVALLAAGLDKEQAAIIDAGALGEAQKAATLAVETGLRLSTAKRVVVIAPAVVTGAVAAVAKLAPTIPDTAARTAVVNVVMTSTVGSAAAQSAELTPGETQDVQKALVVAAVTAVPVAGLAKDNAPQALTAVASGATVGLAKTAPAQAQSSAPIIAAAMVESLPHADVPDALLSAALGGAASGIVGSLTKGGVAGAGLAATAASVAQVSVASLKSLSLSDAQMTAAVGSTVGGVVGALTAGGVAADQVADAAQQVATSAVNSLTAAGVSSEKVGGMAGAIVGGSIQGLATAGLSAAQIVQSNAISQIVKSAAAAAATASSVAGEQAGDVIGAIAGAAVGALGSAGFAAAETRNAALTAIVNGAFDAASDANGSDLTKMGSTMATVANQVVAALPQAGVAAGDTAASAAVIVKAALAGSGAADAKDAASAIAFAGKVTAGAMAGAGKLSASGFLDAAQTSSAATSTSGAAIDNLVTLQQKGIVASTGDIAAFTAGIAQNVLSGLSAGGASGATVQNANADVAAATSSPQALAQLKVSDAARAEIADAVSTGIAAVSAKTPPPSDTVAPPAAAAPAFSLAAGTFASPQSVAITAETGATIRYTTDDSTPTASSAVYSAPIAIGVTMTLKAYAAKAGATDSPLATASYTITGTVAPPLVAPGSGTYPSPQTVTLSAAAGATIYYTTDGSPPTPTSSVYGNPITVGVTQTLKAYAVKAGWADSSPATAAYTITGRVAPPSFAPAGGAYTSPQIVTLSAAAGATIFYTTDGSTPTNSSSVYGNPIAVGATQTIKAFAIKANWADSSPASAAYTITGTVGSPTFTPSGGTFSSPQTVTLSAAAGATIYYTTDGTTPTNSSSVYGNAITVGATQTLKAYAVKAGWADSSPASAAYTITGTVTTPTFAPPGGSYGAPQTVAITSPDGTVFCSTTDGSTPACAGDGASCAAGLAGSPVVLPASATLKAVACQQSWQASTQASASYQIDSAPPVPGAAGALVVVPSATGAEVEWTAATDDASAAGALSYEVYYSTSSGDLSSVAAMIGGATSAGGPQTAVSSKTVSGLNPMSAYFFNVIVTDTAGRKAAYSAAAATTYVPGPTCVAGNTPLAGVRLGSLTYYGGSFIAAGPCFGNLATLDASSGALVGNTFAAFPRVSSGWEGVRAAVSDGQGGWYVGGSMFDIGGTTVHSLAHIDSSGTPDAWTPDVGGAVNTLALVGTKLYVGGYFDPTVGVPRQNLAVFDTSTGQLASWDPEPDGEVDVLLVDGSDLLVGGDFGEFDDPNGTYYRSRLAVFDVSGATPVLNTTFPQADGAVRALAVGGGTLYLGGWFTEIGNNSNLSGLGAVNRSTGAVSSWAPSVEDGSVNALAVVGNTLYVGGGFTGIDSVPLGGLAAISLPGHAIITAFGIGVADGEVNAILPSGQDLYIGGSFMAVDGQERLSLAKITVSGGGTGTLDAAWNPSMGGGVNTLALDGSTVFVGGGMVTLGGGARRRLMAVDDSGALAPWNPGADGDVHAVVAAADGTIYIGGMFTHVGGQARNRAAAVDQTGAVVAAFDPDVGISSGNDGVYALALSGSRVFLAGNFSSVGGVARAMIAAVDGASGALDSTWYPGAVSGLLVDRLAADASNVYLGGSFTAVGGTARSNIAAVSASGSGGLLSSWNPGTNGWVHGLLVDGTRLYVSGGFSSIGGAGRSGIAALNAASGAVQSWQSAVGGNVFALAVSGSNLYFSKTSSDHLVAVDKTSGTQSQTFSPVVDGHAQTIVPGPSTLNIGGGFFTLSGTPHRFVGAVNLSDGAPSW